MAVIDSQSLAVVLFHGLSAHAVQRCRPPRISSTAFSAHRIPSQARVLATDIALLTVLHTAVRLTPAHSMTLDDERF